MTTQATLCARLFPPLVATAETFAVDAESGGLFASEAAVVQNANDKRRREFAAGRRCARAALEQLGFGRAPLTASADRRPRWPAGAVGSITHTDGYCAAAAARRHDFRAVGIDAERVGRATGDIWHAICTAEELEWIAGCDEDRRNAMVTVLFSAKEAFYKCQFELTESWLDFHDVTVRIDGDRFEAHVGKAEVARKLPRSLGGRLRIVGDLVLAGIVL